MDKKTRKNIIRALAGAFWLVLLVLARSQRFKTEKNPYIYAIIGISMVGLLIYENFYRLPKIEKTKNALQDNQLKLLLERRHEYEPEINPEQVPEAYHCLIPLVKKWGISNNILREHLYESANDEELLELKKIEKESDSIKSWIDESDKKSTEITSFKLTLAAYNELGLWTWKTNC